MLILVVSLFGSKLVNTLRSVLMVFTRSRITPTKVNRFGLNLERSEYIVGGWPWQILSAICAVARSKEPGKMLFLSYKQRTILPISRRPNFTKFEHNTSTGVAINLSGQNLRNLSVRGHFSTKPTKNDFFNVLLCDFRPP